MSLLLTTLACATAMFVFVVFVRWVEAGLFGLLAVQLCTITFGPNATIVAHFHLTALDAVSVMLLAAGAIRFSRKLRVVTAARLLAAAYLALFTWSFARGCLINGFLAAANEARGFVGPLVALMYFADAPADEQSMPRYVRWYLLFAAGLCVTAALAAAGLPLGISAPPHFDANDHRVLPSSAVAIIAISSFLAVARATYGVRRFGAVLAPALFLFAAIYLRHRTVWVMLLVGIVALPFLDSAVSRRIMPITAAAALVVGLVAVGGDQLGMANQDEFAQSLSSTETWQWRVNGWQEFLGDAAQSPLTILAGQPMGSRWWRIDPESHLLQTAPPHSEYVTEYLRVGGVGLMFILLFSIRPLGTLCGAGAMNEDVIYPCSAIWVVTVLMALVYATTYSIEPELYALLGIANATVDQRPLQEAVAENQESAPVHSIDIERQHAFL